MTTTSTATELDIRRGPGRPTKPRTMADDLAQSLDVMADARSPRTTGMRWPNERYQRDPVAFAREVLGVVLWDRPIEILEAVRDHPRVAVSSGHKISKSFLAAIIALWFYCSFHEARVVLSSVTSRQVDRILWRELRMMVSRSGRCGGCRTRDPYGLTRCPECSERTTTIDGDLHELARSGLISNDFREIVGFTAREAEAVAGVSGKHLLYLLDEASGIPNTIFEAIEGNRAAQRSRRHGEQWREGTSFGPRVRSCVEPLRGERQARAGSRSRTNATAEVS